MALDGIGTLTRETTRDWSRVNASLLHVLTVINSAGVTGRTGMRGKRCFAMLSSEFAALCSGIGRPSIAPDVPLQANDCSG